MDEVGVPSMDEKYVWTRGLYVVVAVVVVLSCSVRMASRAKKEALMTMMNVDDAVMKTDDDDEKTVMTNDGAKLEKRYGLNS